MDDGPPRFRQDSSCPVLLRNSSRGVKPFQLQGFYLLGQIFPNPSSKLSHHFTRLLLPPAPKNRVWAPPPSLAATGGISVDFFSCGYLDGSVPRVRLRRICIQPRMAGRSPRRVPPFGNPGVKNRLRLVRAYRSRPRPSSLPEAKASAPRPPSPC